MSSVRVSTQMELSKHRTSRLVFFCGVVFVVRHAKQSKDDGIQACSICSTAQPWLHLLMLRQRVLQRTSCFRRLRRALGWE